MQYSDFPSIIHALGELGDPLFDKPYQGPLTERERHLLGIAVAATKGCSDCVSARINKAIESGIDMKLIKESVNLVTYYNAGFVMSAVVRACKSHETNCS